MFRAVDSIVVVDRSSLRPISPVNNFKLEDGTERSCPFGCRRGDGGRPGKGETRRQHYHGHSRQRQQGTIPFSESEVAAGNL